MTVQLNVAGSFFPKQLSAAAAALYFKGLAIRLFPLPHHRSEMPAFSNAASAHLILLAQELLSINRNTSRVHCGLKSQTFLQVVRCNLGLLFTVFFTRTRGCRQLGGCRHFEESPLDRTDADNSAAGYRKHIRCGAGETTWPKLTQALQLCH